MFCLFTAALQTYHVYVITGNKMGAGTDANVYIVLFGEHDDTGKLSDLVNKMIVLCSPHILMLMSRQSNLFKQLDTRWPQKWLQLPFMPYWLLEYYRRKVKK